MDINYSMADMTYDMGAANMGGLAMTDGYLEPHFDMAQDAQNAQT